MIMIKFKNKEKKGLPLTHLTKGRGRATKSCSSGPQANVSSPSQLSSGKKPTCKCKRYKKSRFRPWVGKISRSRAWQPTPVFMPGESHGQQPDRLYVVHRVPKSPTQLKRLGTQFCQPQGFSRRCLEEHIDSLAPRNTPEGKGL